MEAKLKHIMSAWKINHASLIFEKCGEIIQFKNVINMNYDRNKRTPKGLTNTEQILNSELI